MGYRTAYSINTNLSLAYDSEIWDTHLNINAYILIVARCLMGYWSNLGTIMPYYIYRIAEPMRLEYLDQKASFRDAKERVVSLRKELSVNNTTIVRMIFANSTGEAERLLSIPKDGRVIGED